MSRIQRSHHVHAFDTGGDFNEQLYGALRNSPWWMISVSVHVLLFVVLGLLSSETAVAEAEPQAVIHSTAAPDEVEVEDPIVDQRAIQDVEHTTKEPVIKDDPVSDHVESDNDLPNDESLGDEGLSDAQLKGPSTNGLIGLGGAAGGAFGGRGGRMDLGGGRRGGRTEDAVEDALRWLAAHQNPNGSWEAEGFWRWCDGHAVPNGPEGRGKVMYDAGVTGLALCAFLGAGYTNRGQHPFCKVVARGLSFLKAVQDPEGCFGPRTTQHFIYNHATASLAMVEAYGMTESPLFKNSAQRALDFISLARNPYFAWRYGVKPGDNDTSVTGWMMMALKSARLINEDALKRGKPAPLSFDESAFDGVRSWVEKMTDPDYGRVGYVQRGSGPARPQEMLDRFPAEKSESMTGVGILARVFIGEDPRRSEAIKKGADLCLKALPTWNPNDGSIDMYYWYYATLAMFQVGGQHWKAWNEALKTAVVDNQRKDTEYCMYKGSWDPIGPWGADGGRVYSTAMLAMCLEVYYRYPKVFGAGGH